jgi:hypothetical protein
MYIGARSQGIVVVISKRIPLGPSLLPQKYNSGKKKRLNFTSGKI